MAKIAGCVMQIENDEKTAGHSERLQPEGYCDDGKELRPSTAPDAAPYRKRGAESGFGDRPPHGRGAPGPRNEPRTGVLAWLSPLLVARCIS